MRISIGGVDVKFPFQPYPSQLALMSQLIRSMNNRTHACLESPTGSGKTMALLCGALAWQQKQRETFRAQAQEKAASHVAAAMAAANATVTGDDDLLMSAVHAMGHNLLEQQAMHDQALANELKSADSVCSKVYYASRTHSQLKQVVKELRQTSYRPRMSVMGSREHYCLHKDVSRSSTKNDDCKKLLEINACSYAMQMRRLQEHPALRVPAGELAVWDVEDLVSLGRRTNGCPYLVSRAIAERSELIMCPYSYLLDPLIREAIDIKLDNSVLIIDEAHNCEDVCREALSKSFELCAAQKLVEDCEIVLQQLKDDHKLRGFYCQIADLFRSISALLIRTRESFPSDAEMGSVPVHNDPRSGPAVLDLLDQCGFSPNTSVALGLAKSNLVQAHKFQNSDQVTPSTIEPVLNAASVATLESFFLVADIILLHCSDFRAVVFKERRPVIEQVEASNAGPRSRRKGSFQSRTQSDSSQPKPEESPFTVKLTLWCMNPALAFSLCSKSARSVILASGTLSPMKLMVSELGQPFPQQLEAMHVIEPSQIHVAVLPVGPASVPGGNAVPLAVTYQNTQQQSFQDSVGLAILQLIQIIPDGTLVFFPSYALMDRLVERWRHTGLFDRLNHYKRVCIEPRRSDEFDIVMSTYKSAATASGPADDAGGTAHEAADTEPELPEAGIEIGYDRKPDFHTNRRQSSDFRHPPKSSRSRFSNSTQNVAPAAPSQRGAIFLAVYRGKISEGIDFVDSMARAVLCVGIPFSNVQDLQVKLKRSFNDQRCRDATPDARAALLDGSSWYTLSAFRALNQAIGRCIRHRYDYGAVIMLDERLATVSSVGYLSNWVRRNVQHPPSFDQALCDVADFFERLRVNPPRAPPPPPADPDVSHSGPASRAPSPHSALLNDEPAAEARPTLSSFLAAARVKTSAQARANSMQSRRDGDMPALEGGSEQQYDAAVDTNAGFLLPTHVDESSITQPSVDNHEPVGTISEPGSSVAGVSEFDHKPRFTSMMYAEPEDIVPEDTHVQAPEPVIKFEPVVSLSQPARPMPATFGSSFVARCHAGSIFNANFASTANADTDADANVTTPRFSVAPSSQTYSRLKLRAKSTPSPAVSADTAADTTLVGQKRPLQAEIEQ